VDWKDVTSLAGMGDEIEADRKDVTGLVIRWVGLRSRLRGKTSRDLRVRRKDRVPPRGLRQDIRRDVFMFLLANATNVTTR